MRSVTRTIGILTSGGDCPGLNAAIRGVAKAAFGRYGMRIIGISDGYRGLIEGRARELTPDDVSGILTRGGTILGTSREKPFRSDKPEKNGSVRDAAAGRKKPEAIIENYRSLGLDALVILGGNGTVRTADLLRREGLNVVVLPKTIDNDVWGTDVTFGFQSAVDIAAEAIDRLHSTAHSHNRVMVIEVMGHRAGWLALHAGVAGGGDVILIPEIPYRIDSVVKRIERRAAAGKAFSIVVVAEGAVPDEAVKRKLFSGRTRYGSTAISYPIARQIEQATGMETRVTVLGYLQRGGPPSPFDRVLATEFGTAAVELLHRGEYGTLVALEGNRIVSRPLEECAGKLKTVPPDLPLIGTARNIGIGFGDE
jgi:phosphofructokinase-like protein